MKQWMKKSLAACLALVMCLTLAACGGKEGETPAEESVNVRVAALKGPTAIVIGSEGEGMGRLVGESCDFTVSIPMFGKINSLNPSAAAAVLLYEAVRQRTGN